MFSKVRPLPVILGYVSVRRRICTTTCEGRRLDFVVTSIIFICPIFVSACVQRRIVLPRFEASHSTCVAEYQFAWSPQLSALLSRRVAKFHGRLKIGIDFACVFSAFSFICLRSALHRRDVFGGCACSTLLFFVRLSVVTLELTLSTPSPSPRPSKLLR